VTPQIEDAAKRIVARLCIRRDVEAHMATLREELAGFLNELAKGDDVDVYAESHRIFQRLCIVPDKCTKHALPQELEQLRRAWLERENERP
jgi:hypothetical protein